MDAVNIYETSELCEYDATGRCSVAHAEIKMSRSFTEVWKSVYCLNGNDFKQKFCYLTN